MTTPLNPDTLAQLRRLLAEATPGPWVTGWPDDHCWVAFADNEGESTAHESRVISAPRWVKDGSHNAALIAAAINALPALLDAAEAARETTPTEECLCDAFDYEAEGPCRLPGHDSRVVEEHDPRCYQRTGVPDDLPAGICDCRILRMIDAHKSTAAEVGLREAVEAVRAFCEEHRGQWTPGMEKARMFTFDGGVGAAAQDVLALLAEHPAPAPEAEVAAGERAACGYEGWQDGEARCGCGRRFESMESFERHVGFPATPPADDATPAPAEPKAVEVDAGDFSWQIVAGVRCHLVHDQIVGAWCVNCESWARNIGEPFWRPSFAALLDRERRAERERITKAIGALPKHYVQGDGGGWLHAVRTHDLDGIIPADALGAAGEGTGGAG